VILAAYSKSIDVDINNVVLLKALSIHGSFAYSSQEMLEVIELVSSGKVDLTSIVTHEFPLQQLPEAFETQANSQISVKVLVDID
jgi:threonine dehydrogenase-like Zn-dependent dehydrogenase